MSFALVIDKQGPWETSVKRVDTSADVNLETPLEDGQVLIQFLASTINPSDVGIVEGWYPVTESFPLTPGNEGIGHVLKVGPGVNKLSVGDHVMPGKGLFGTWRSHAIAAESDLIKIDKDLDVETACQLMVNPPTAYRMLKDFVDLKPGDCVLQNGANSAVGVLVIQMCKAWGVKTINVIRSRPDPKETANLIQSLVDYGATHVVTEQEIANESGLTSIWEAGTPKPILAFECIGGENAANCIKHLAHGATMVIYGTMTKQPVPIPAGPTIFKGLKFAGFWLATVFKSNHEEYYRMSAELVSMFKSGQLKSPKVAAVPMENYQEALTKSTKGFTSGKVILTNQKIISQ